MPPASAKEASGLGAEGAWGRDGAMRSSRRIGPALPVSSSIQASPDRVGTAASTVSASPSASRTRRIGTGWAPSMRRRRLDGVSTISSWASGRIVSARPAKRSRAAMPSRGGIDGPIIGWRSRMEAVGALKLRAAMVRRRSSQRGVSRRSPVARPTLHVRRVWGRSPPAGPGAEPQPYCQASTVTSGSSWLATSLSRTVALRVKRAPSGLAAAAVICRISEASARVRMGGRTLPP